MFLLTQFLEEMGMDEEVEGLEEAKGPEQAEEAPATAADAKPDSAPSPEPTPEQGSKRRRIQLRSLAGRAGNLLKRGLRIAISLALIGVALFGCFLVYDWLKPEGEGPLPKFKYRVAVGKTNPAWGCYFTNQKPQIRVSKRKSGSTVNIVLLNARSAMTTHCSPESAREAKASIKKVSLTIPGKKRPIVIKPGTARNPLF